MRKLDTYLNGHLGVVIALLVLACWGGVLAFGLTVNVADSLLLSIGLVLVQTHLYTGIFITAHDAIHGTVSKKKWVNETFGWSFTLLFAFNWYPRLRRKHWEHHSVPGTEEDPDFYAGSFFRWYLDFVMQYVSLWQILAMAITFNLLILVFPEVNIILFWMLPAVLSTFQLFFFGTYLPHRGDHSPSNVHRARSQEKNHIFAFLSCYFFGYHLEHHEAPATPWWLLYEQKE